MLGDDGLPDFGALQNAFDGSNTDALVYSGFDLLWLDGEDWHPAPLLDHRARLTELLQGNSSAMLRLSEQLPPDPQSLLASACQLDMEGVISKRASAAYRSGRSTDWIKLKCGQGDEFIIAASPPVRARAWRRATWARWSWPRPPPTAPCGRTNWRV